MASLRRWAKYDTGRNAAATTILMIVAILQALNFMHLSDAKTVLYNYSGDDLQFAWPAAEATTTVPYGESLELQRQYLRRVVIRDLQSGDEVGPLDLPDGQSLAAVPARSAPISVSVGNTRAVNVRVGSTVVIRAVVG